MIALRKSHVFGLLLLLTFAAHIAYFKVPFVANDYGSQIEEWPLLLDLLVTLPLLYYLMFRPPLKDFLLRCFGILSVGVLFGRWMIPEGSKQIWLLFEQAWPLVIALGIVLEVVAVVVIARKIMALTRLNGDVDSALRTTLFARLGRKTGALVLFEAQIWYYGLLLRKGERLRYQGEQHFYYHQHQDNASNQLAFIMVMLFEMPLMHLLLHFMMDSPVLAYVIDGLSLCGVVYMVAEYRASHWRPVSLDQSALLIRYGVFATDRSVPYHLIESVTRYQGTARRQRGLLRFCQMAAVNVEIRLRPGSMLETRLGGEEPVQRIVIGLDQPDAFVAAVRARLAAA